MWVYVWAILIGAVLSIPIHYWRARRSYDRDRRGR